MQDVQNIQGKHKNSKRTKQGNHRNQPMGGQPQPPQGWPKPLGVSPKGRKGEGGSHHGHFSFSPNFKILSHLTNHFSLSLNSQTFPREGPIRNPNTNIILTIFPCNKGSNHKKGAITYIIIHIYTTFIKEKERICTFSRL